MTGWRSAARRSTTSRATRCAPARAGWRPVASLADADHTQPAADPAPLTLRLPDPSLVVLIGPAGAGKTTFARRHFEAAEIVSSDALRAIVGSGEGDQSVSRTAFSILHRQVESRLRRGLLTVVDATNLGNGARRPLLWRARRHAFPAVAIVFDLPGSVVHERNASRAERVVGAAIVDDQLARLRNLVDLGTFDVEGFEAVHRFPHAEAVDSARISRVNRPISSPAR